MNLEFNINDIFGDIFNLSIFSIFTFITLIYFIYKDKLTFFPKVRSFNELKTHSFKYRGLGILYIISLFPFLCKYFSLNEITLIILLTLLGFTDDKYDMNSKLKLFLFILISFVYNMLDANMLKSHLVVNDFIYFFSKFIILIFLILFFNQIDGINGLAGLTYVFSILIIFIVFGNSIIFFPFLLLVIIYLCFNLKGKIGIQGDSGSYFLASTFFILVNKFTNNFNIFYSLFYLCPILFDVVSTTLIRISMKKNILYSHTNNLYQKIAVHYNSHLISTFCFIFFQIIFSLFSIYFFYKGNETLIIFVTIFVFLMFIYVSYLIDKEKIFKIDEE